MGKNKGNKGAAGKGPAGKGKKAQKDKGGLGPSIKKTKPKAVASNLKKLNLQTKARTEKADEAFRAVREAVVGSAKPAKSVALPKATPADRPSSTVDMDATTETFAKL